MSLRRPFTLLALLAVVASLLAVGPAVPARAAAGDLIPAQEPATRRSEADQTRRRTRRQVFLAELRAALRSATLDSEARDFADMALDQMKDPKLWALWAQLLISVQETRRAIPSKLEERIAALLSDSN